VIDGKSYAPDFWKKYDTSVPWKTRVDTVADWFANQGVEFATLYMNEPDSVGHTYGPDSTQVNTKLAALDTDLSYLLTKLESVGQRSTLDIIIVSDHGMYNWQKVLTLGSHFGIPNSYYTCWQYGAHMQLDATSDANRAAIYNALKGSKDLQVFYKHETPDRLHYDSSNPRISEILVLPNIGVYMRPGTSNSTGNKATHGWDNAASQMGAMFIANGPSFKKNYQLAKNINQVDIYPLMTHLLGITGQAHDGSLSAISPVLSKPPFQRKYFRGSA
jgi:ectonucleotide pyrophosphatase/phosphodiesterase family protein 5